MKKDCERTRRAFPRYLHGHVFRIERVRIERHLAACVICRSEFEGLRRAEETRRILKDVDVSTGLVQQVKDSVVSLSKLKKIFYRPLWLAAIVLAAAGVYHYTMMPRQLDLEIEKIVKTEPATTPAVYPAEEKTETSMATMPVVSTRPVKPPSAPVVEPLVVNIIPDNEKAAVLRINEVLHGQGPQLRGKKFSETVREVSGSLTAGELEIFFDRIEQVARVSFNRRWLESVPGTQSIPFKLKLRAVPKTVEKHPPSAMAQMPVPTQAPTGSRIPAAPVTGPTTSIVPATGPTPSTVE